MQINKKPTKEQLLELYEAAIAFKKLKPWLWLHEADLICVENPRDKTMGYCSVMGKAGEHFALGVYLGNDGLYRFCKLMDYKGDIPSHQALHLQNCIMCSFEDRDILTNQDRKQIQELGLSFRGRNEWPMFRRYEPGYYPWYINEEECIFLTTALMQIQFVAENILNGQLKIDLAQSLTILRYSEEKDGQLIWNSKVVKLEYPTEMYKMVEITDDLLIKKIEKAGRMGNVTLQTDIRYMPSPVHDKKDKRMYFPRTFIIAEKNTGLLLDYDFYESSDDDISVTLNRMINFCLKNGIPKEIHVCNKEMFAILADFCKKVDIKLSIVKKLTPIDEFIDELDSHFNL